MTVVAAVVDFEWTAPRERALIEAWYGPLPTPVIAASFGVSKNAVIGKAHRMGLGDRIRVAVKRNAGNAVPGQAERTRLTGAGETSRPLKSLADLGPDQCRFPEGEPGEPGFGFCGERAAAERPYCEAHCDVAYDRRPRRPDTRDPDYATSVDRWRL